MSARLIRSMPTVRDPGRQESLPHGVHQIRTGLPNWRRTETNWPACISG